MKDSIGRLAHLKTKRNPSFTEAPGAEFIAVQTEKGRKRARPATWCPKMECLSDNDFLSPCRAGAILGSLVTCCSPRGMIQC